MITQNDVEQRQEAPSSAAFSTGRRVALRIVRRLGRGRAIVVVVSLMCAYAAYFSYFAILKHLSFHSFAYDLGIFTQYFWMTLNGHGLFYTSVLESSMFAWHFQPILFLILPLYALWPHPETLLVLQSVFLALGALPVFLIARDRLGEVAGVVFAGLYLLYPALHGVNSFDFHPVALAIPMLLWLFWALRQGRYRQAFVWAVLAMMCKENVTLVVVFLGFYWWYVARGDSSFDSNWRALPLQREAVAPLLLSTFGAVWFVVAVGVVIPHFSLSGAYPYFSRYGYGFSVTMLLFDSTLKAQYLHALLSPLGFVPLLSPPALLIAAPILAQNLLTSHLDQCRIVYHYSALIIPWVFVAAVQGVRRVASIGGVRQPETTRWLLAILVLCSVFATLLVSPSPLALDYPMPRLGPHESVLNDAIAMIPDSASVYTQNDRFSHVCERRFAYVHLPQPGVNMFEFYGGRYDFILMDTTSEQCTLDFATQESLNTLESEYGIYASGDGVCLYKRGYDGETLDLL